MMDENYNLQLSRLPIKYLAEHVCPVSLLLFYVYDVY